MQPSGMVLRINRGLRREQVKEDAVAVVTAVLVLLRAFLKSHLALAAEILALRQQLAILQRTTKRPRLRQRDRVQ